MITSSRGVTARAAEDSPPPPWRGMPPPPANTIHCLNGNLLRALIGFGRLDDPRVQSAIEWAARAITGEGVTRWYAATCGPGFACGANDRLPCAWGALKELSALARVPDQRRTRLVRDAIDAGVTFLFSRDPADAAPHGLRHKPNGSWFSEARSGRVQIIEVSGWGGRTERAPEREDARARHG